MLDCKMLIDDLVADAVHLAQLKQDWLEIADDDSNPASAEMEYDYYSDKWEFVRGRLQMLNVCLKMIGVDEPVAEKLHAFIESIIDDENAGMSKTKALINHLELFQEQCRRGITEILKPLAHWHEEKIEVLA